MHVYGKVWCFPANVSCLVVAGYLIAKFASFHRIARGGVEVCPGFEEVKARLVEVDPYHQNRG